LAKPIEPVSQGFCCLATQKSLDALGARKTRLRLADGQPIMIDRLEPFNLSQIASEVDDFRRSQANLDDHHRTPRIRNARFQM
jgi:hypothetical protein